MTGQGDQRIRRTTIGCVALLALIAGTVSYLHMHLLVELHGQPGCGGDRIGDSGGYRSNHLTLDNSGSSILRGLVTLVTAS